MFDTLAISPSFHFHKQSHSFFVLCSTTLSNTGSPFAVPIKDKVDPSRVRCYGPGLGPRGARAQQPATFTVDASQAGEAPIHVSDAGNEYMIPRSDQLRLQIMGLGNYVDLTEDTPEVCQIILKFVDK